MWVAGPFTFCALCGVHLKVSVRKLAKECPRRVTSVAMARALDRLKLGLHPTTDDTVGAPVSFSVSPPPFVGHFDGVTESDSEIEGF